MRRAETDGYARHARDRLNDAHELRWPERAAIVVEARREVGDAHRPATTVNEFGHHDGGITHIIRAALDLSVEHYVGEAFFLIAGQQPAEHWVAVVARLTPP